MKEKQTFIVIDAANLFFRAIHVVKGGHGPDVMAGAALHTIMTSIRKVWLSNTTGSNTHLVFAWETPKDAKSNNWRTGVYPKYKLARKVAKINMSQKDAEDQAILFEAFNDFRTFIEEKTNATSLSIDCGEGDDVMGAFIQSHPDDNVVLISTDSDFFQLLRQDNLKIYNGVTQVLYHKDEITNERGKRLAFSIKSDGKVKLGKPDASFVAPDKWHELCFFIKLLKGDSSDGIDSAYPRIRLNGSAKKPGIMEAWADMDRKGFDWNTVMLHKWENIDGEEVVVSDMYARNKTLIDLRCQPQFVKDACTEALATALSRTPVTNVGIHFLRFCGTWDLPKVASMGKEFGVMFNNRYKHV